MPILNFHLVQGQHTAAKVETLLLKASALFAEVLACPIERVRVFVTEHAPQHFCVGGKLVSQHDQVLVDILGAPRANVRGGIVPVAPADWSIGGTPANQLRQAEIEARRLAAAAN